MPKKICPNGHIYDSSIYGEECPLCPKGGDTPQNFGGGMSPDMGNNGATGGASAGTRVSPPGSGNMQIGRDGMGAPQMGGQKPMSSYDAAVGETQFGGGARPAPKASMSAGTVIRPPRGAANVNGRKLVGFLVTYNRNPLGKAYELYEGKNYIGRDKSCDICIGDDNQISGRHMSILYRNVDNKFKYRDEQSSNGTFVNKELSDEGELQNFDIIRLGGTVFIFIAIPQLGQ